MPEERPHVSPSREAFTHSKPLILTVFVNRVGTIGLSLLPILLVQRGFTSQTSTFVMGGTKSVVIYGTLLAGALTDRLGARNALLFGFFAIGVGLCALPFPQSAFLILIFAMIAQFGDALVRVSMRMLLTLTVPKRLHKEAFAWVRTVNNLGQIFSFGLGTLGAKLGILPLMLFDGVTGFAALFVGGKILPPLVTEKKESVSSGKPSWAAVAAFVPALACSLVIFSWNFYYELFLSGIAARLEILHRGQGLGYFSTLMVVNTILCTVFAVKVASFVSRPSRVFPVGLSLTVSGLLLGVSFASNLVAVAGAMFVVTMGELLLGALGQLTQIRLLPEGKAEGFFYSMMVVIAQSGRLVGAALVFPWIASAPAVGWHVPIAFWIPIVVVFGVIVRNRRIFDQAIA